METLLLSFSSPTSLFFSLPLSILLTLSSSFFANVVDLLCVFVLLSYFSNQNQIRLPKQKCLQYQQQQNKQRTTLQHPPPKTPNNAQTNTDQELTPENGLQDQNSK